MTIILPDSCILRLPSILLLHHLNQARQVMDLEENADTDRILTVVPKNEWCLTRMCCCGNNPNVLHTPPTPDADQALQASGIATGEGLDARIRPRLKCPENIYGHIMGGYSMKLQIITPFSRTRENIRAIYSSLESLAAHVETEWVIVYQHNACHELMEWHRAKEQQQFLKVTMLRGNTATSYYGNSYRNQALRELRTNVDSWVYFTAVP